MFLLKVSGPVVWVKYNISLLGCHSYDRSTYVHNTRKGAVQFLADRRSSSRGWKKFISLEAVTAPSSSLLHEGGLLIRCTVNWFSATLEIYQLILLQWVSQFNYFNFNVFCTIKPHWSKTLSSILRSNLKVETIEV